MLEATNQLKKGSLVFRFKNQQLPKSSVKVMAVILRDQTVTGFLFQWRCHLCLDNVFISSVSIKQSSQNMNSEHRSRPFKSSEKNREEALLAPVGRENDTCSYRTCSPGSKCITNAFAANSLSLIQRATWR